MIQITCYELYWFFVCFCCGDFIRHLPEGRIHIGIKYSYSNSNRSVTFFMLVLLRRTSFPGHLLSPIFHHHFYTLHLQVFPLCGVLMRFSCLLCSWISYGLDRHLCPVVHHRRANILKSFCSVMSLHGLCGTSGLPYCERGIVQLLDFTEKFLPLPRFEPRTCLVPSRYATNWAILAWFSKKTMNNLPRFAIGTLTTSQECTHQASR